MRKNSLLLVFRKTTIALLFACLLTQIVSAQDETAFEQGFVYRDGDQLMFVNPYVEPVEAVPLPGIVASQRDWWEWSPDGRYLVALLHQDESANYGRCLNLYDVDLREWVYDEPVICDFSDAAISPESTQIAYATHDQNDAYLWLLTLANDYRQPLYDTTDRDFDEINNVYFIDGIDWSPTGRYLMFTYYSSVIGGTINSALMMDVINGRYQGVGAGYYAGFDPIWSPDDEWYLVVIQEEYVTSGTLPYSNHQGDLYLINSEDGHRNRITFTPADLESNIEWVSQTEFTFDTTQHLTYNVEDAMNIAPVPSENIVYPEAVDSLEFHSSNLSPDGEFGVQFISTTGNTARPEILRIIARYGEVFSTNIPNLYPLTDIIGWRPAPAETTQP
jgi:hypothetical protein